MKKFKVGDVIRWKKRKGGWETGEIIAIVKKNRDVAAIDAGRRLLLGNINRVSRNERYLVQNANGKIFAPETHLKSLEFAIVEIVKNECSENQQKKPLGEELSDLANSHALINEELNSAIEKIADACIAAACLGEHHTLIEIDGFELAMIEKGRKRIMEWAAKEKIELEEIIDGFEARW